MFRRNLSVKEKLVLIGNGMAGMRTIEELLNYAPDLYDITVFGAEPCGNYNRILLSGILAGEKSLGDITLNTMQWYADNGITLHAGKEVIEINRAKRYVRSGEDVVTPYDRLIIATGARPRVLPIQGSDLKNIFVFRDVSNVEQMIKAAQTGKKAVVIGGGLLGLEAAQGLLTNGLEVTVVEYGKTLMALQLDDVAGGMLRKSLESRGLNILTSSQVVEIQGNGSVSGVILKDGARLPADIVVMAAGITPNIELARSSGLYCENGIVVSDTMQSFDARIYAVGECVQHRKKTYGFVAPLFEMAKVCANHLAKLGYGRYEGSITSTQLKVSGIKLFTAGDINSNGSTEEIVLKDEAENIYKKILVKDKRIVGTILYGDTVDGPWYFQLLREKRNIDDIRKTLLLGAQAGGDPGREGRNVAATMSDDTEVCGCNGVCKGNITEAISEKGLFTVEDVRTHTKASASCGSCTGLVEQILAATLGENFSRPEKKSVCGCTELTHDEVKKTIKEYELKSIADAMKFMEWDAIDGCEVCRPALNYYVISSWPLEAEDEGQSRIIDERAHANIQKDGTYSVAPRIFGGVTTPGELRAIADVAEKHRLPMVKFTGGQRLAMFGVKKEQLPVIWSDLSDAGFVSGHAYAKGLRTVKTCVGTQWCKFGTQDSVELGISLEKNMWGSWTPAKFKLAVSGCPRNCAEATVKDIGIIGVDSGWELYVGGNCGIKVRVTDLLCKLKSAGDVLEHSIALLQLYREETRYGERTAPWVERVGLSYIKKKVVEDGNSRMDLVERFRISQKENSDPWKKRALNKDEQSEFKSLELPQMA